MLLFVTPNNARKRDSLNNDNEISLITFPENEITVNSERLKFKIPLLAL